MKKYYLTDGKDTFGPFFIEELKEKSITRESYVWHEGMDNWTKAGELQEFDHLFPSRVIIPPPIKPQGIRPPIIPEQPVTMHQTYGYPQQPNTPKKSNKLLIGLSAAGMLVVVMVALFATGVLDIPISSDDSMVSSSIPLTGNPEKDATIFAKRMQELTRFANRASKDGVLDSREIRKLEQLFQELMMLEISYKNDEDGLDQINEYLENNSPEVILEYYQAIEKLIDCEGFNKLEERFEKISEQADANFQELYID